jgi:hypothetical protein
MSAPEDGGRLSRALAALGTGDVTGLERLPRPAACALWDELILQGVPGRRHRHGMLLDRSHWPNATRGDPVDLPLPDRFRSARLWLICWMRERAALVPGHALEAALDELLRDDDEALIAVNTDTLDSLQSWGGSRRWITMRRPG